MATGGFDFYAKLFSKLDTNLLAFWHTTVESIINGITPVATTLITIYVVLWGWSMMRGVISEPITDGITRIVRLSVITAIALSAGRYHAFLSNMLWYSPEQLAAYVSSSYSTGSGTMGFLDSLMKNFYDFGTAYNDAAWKDASVLGMPDLSLWLTGILLWIVGLILTGYAAFLYALSKIALALILGVGPIFILLTVFEPTKRFFDAWLGQALNYVFLVMLAAGSVKLIFSIIEGYLTSPGMAAIVAEPSVNQAFPALIFSVIGVLVMMQCPSISSALGGGVALSTLGAVGWAYSKMNGAAKGGVDLVSGKSLSDMRAARRAKLTNARWAQRNPSLPARATGAAAGMPKAIYRKITGSSTNRVARG